MSNIVQLGKDTEQVATLKRILEDAKRGEIGGFILVCEYVNGVVPAVEIEGEFDPDLVPMVAWRLGQAIDAMKAVDCDIFNPEDYDQ